MKSDFLTNKSMDLSKLKSKQPTWIALLLLSLVFLPSLSSADENAIKLLNKMNKALLELSYKGNLVLIQGNNVSTLMVDRSVVNGVQSERVVRLNEAGSEVSREIKGFSLSKIPRIRPEMEEIYSFDFGRENRVANIPCRIITARPKDRERYLQKYCIDIVTGMLLDYRLVGKTHKPVEQFMFTNIEIRMPESGQAKITVNTSTPGLIPIDEENAGSKVQTLIRQISNASLEDGWTFEALPAGFEISQAPHMKEVLENDNSEITTKHYILTDGLISMSVFFTPISNKSTRQHAIQIKSGALNMVTQDKGGHRITAVGEVPELTLKNIVKNLRKENN